MMVTLKNEFLAVQIEDLGAQLCSVKNARGTEYIWQADPAIWPRHAPLLFPIIARLRDNQYELEGKTYTIPTHGFARDTLFTVLEQTDSAVSFQLTDSPETLAVWPFPFVLTVTYTLAENRLIKSCRVENRSDKTMYYELGGHDGFTAPLEAGETMADYAIVLPGVDAIRPYGMTEAGVLTPKETAYPLENGRIPLSPAHYGLDTIMLDELPVHRALLVDKAGRARVTLDFPDFPYLGIWTPAKPFDTNYICIEPWTTLPDGTFVGRGLADKAGIRTLAAGDSETLTYTTTFN